uniref:Cation/H+ exchanger transmembrane domain-containing protein n=1 Tax=Thermosporothrix sp. COM3 TaxID=2490863 RepID=A0A455SM64_9CHLR|nr:hypothetical protein KTC_28400 [Thermosporothrix sp. COM3]
MFTGQILLQLIVILLTVQLFGILMRFIGQQWVIGEMLAGLALGPSLLGGLFPGLQQQFFPPQSLPILQVLGDIGLILYMFSLGTRTDIQELRAQSRTAVFVSLGGIIFPLLSGCILGYFLFPTMAGKNASALSLSLLMGVAISITAFPVLARIIMEKKLQNTRAGMLALVCASIGDVFAWCLLAAVAAISRAQSSVSIVLILAYTALFIGCMLFVVRPLLKFAIKQLKSPRLLAVLALITLLLASFTTDKIGIHPIFGAFLTGLILPRTIEFTRQSQSIDQINNMLFLPLFFVVSGLHTQFGLLQGPHLWLLCLLIFLIACLGKIGGSILPARLAAESWRDSFILGILMNTRGLVELIVLNIGLELGILSPALFSIMVLVALATTIMTSPGLQWTGLLPKTRLATLVEPNGSYDRQSEPVQQNRGD